MLCPVDKDLKQNDAKNKKHAPYLTQIFAQNKPRQLLRAILDAKFT